MRSHHPLLASLLACAFAAVAHASSPNTFCNPLNLDYGIYQSKSEPPHRHGADPVVVLFRDRYWLFSTWDRPGYRVSDDLVNWKFIPFGARVEMPDRRGYTAAAAIVLNGWLYFTEFGKSAQRVGLYRTQNPADGSSWEKVVNELPPYADPCLFLDPKSQKLFMYHGMEKPIRGVELDRKTFAEIPGSEKQLMPAFEPSKKIQDGWEVCTWDNSETSKPGRGNKTFFPCREGSWMTLHDGKYHLQYASPGTTVPGYADGLLTSDNPLGPFEYSQRSPISRKDSGFITSAGHGCLFQDRGGKWWRIVTMLIGVHERFERRIGLFPAGFDAEGVPFTRTDFDMPIRLDQSDTGWRPLSYGREMTASSSLADRPPAHASDEEIRTWWSAKTGEPVEWMQVDLGGVREVRAVQANLYEQDASVVKFDEDRHRFLMSVSKDGKDWEIIVDRSKVNEATPHFYVEFDKPMPARFVRISNVFTPGGGKFAVSDLRVFGIVEGNLAAAVTDLKAQREAADRRKVTLSWQTSEGTSEYLVRYGIAKDKLYLSRQTREAGAAPLHSLNNDPPYFFRVDAINDAGITPGTTVAEAP